jgi:hypothetical protein
LFFALTFGIPTINITDALRFADLLSKSLSDNHKIRAQEIAAFLKALYPDDKTI